MRKISQGAAGIISICILGTLFLLAVFYSMPSNVVDKRDGSAQRTSFTEILPESWGFFTKPPNDPELAAFSVNGSSVESALDFPHSQRRNGYGIMRDHRAQGPEIAELTNSVQDNDWVSCDKVEGDCVVYANSKKSATTVNNYFPSRTICGNIVIAETVPVPWSYRDSYNGWRKENRVVHLDVKCN